MGDMGATDDIKRWDAEQTMVMGLSGYASRISPAYSTALAPPPTMRMFFASRIAAAVFRKYARTSSFWETCGGRSPGEWLRVPVAATRISQASGVWLGSRNLMTLFSWSTSVTSPITVRACLTTRDRGIRERSVHSPARTDARMAPILWWTESRLSTHVRRMRPALASFSSSRAMRPPAYLFILSFEESLVARNLSLPFRFHSELKTGKKKKKKKGEGRWRSRDMGIMIPHTQQLPLSRPLCNIVTKTTQRKGFFFVSIMSTRALEQGND